VTDNPTRKAIRWRDLAPDYRDFPWQLFQCDAKCAFATSFVIDFGCIKIVHTAFNGFSDNRVYVVLIGLPPVVTASEGPATKPENWKFQVGMATLAFW
jgi:hypothetical protein